MATYEITLDLKKQTVVPQIVATRVGDIASCKIIAHLTDGGSFYTIPSSASVNLMIGDDTGFIHGQECISSSDLQGDTIVHTLSEVVFATPGVFRTAYFRIDHSSGAIDSTESFVFIALPGVAEKLPPGYVSEIQATIAAMKQQMEHVWGAEEIHKDAFETFLQESQDRLDASLEECATRLEAYQKETNDEVISVIAHARDAAADARNAASQAYSEASSARSRTDIAISHSSSATAMANAAAEAANAATEAANAAAESVRNIETIEDSIAVQAIESLFAA